MAGMPAESRWGSMATTNAALQLAEMVHGSFHRLFLRAFARTEAPPQEIDPDCPDFHAQMQRKIYRALVMLEDSGRRGRLRQQCFIGWPLD
eukprot:1047776-Lingulodinium_polyedra.AAC.1